MNQVVDVAAYGGHWEQAPSRRTFRGRQLVAAQPHGQNLIDVINMSTVGRR
jgi:hypothetical protein